MSNLKHQPDHKEFLLDQGGKEKVQDHLKENVAFDEQHGTNTADWLPKDKFAHHPDNFDKGVRYRAAATSEVLTALEKVKGLIDTTDAGYYDMGCGKGKTLLIAGMTQNFNEVVGVDYYQPFLDIADKNIEKCHLEDINLHFNDMTKFKDFKDTSVVFMYNPADTEIIDKVRQNIEECSSKAIVIYNKPLHSDVFKDWCILDHKVSNDPDHETVILGFGL